MSKPIDLDICVCTYQRPQLRETLQSLFALVVPDGYAISTIVVDNDAENSAEALVTELTKTAPFKVRYVHCPGGNISIARNGALENSDARFLAFIDDDEIAATTWLTNLVSTAEMSAADVVLGPVQATYATSAPKWMRTADFHSIKPVWVNGIIETGYSCNVLIDRQCNALMGVYFDNRYGQSGGEDTVFFNQAFQRGAKIEFAEFATTFEDVPAARASFRWLARRRIRMGQTHGRLLAACENAAIKDIAVAASKAIFCFGSAALHMFSAAKRNGAILRGFLHVGVISGRLGLRDLQLYGPPTAKSAVT